MNIKEYLAFAMKVMAMLKAVSNMKREYRDALENMPSVYKYWWHIGGFKWQDDRRWLIIDADSGANEMLRKMAKHQISKEDLRPLFEEMYHMIHSLKK